MPKPTVNAPQIRIMRHSIGDETNKDKQCRNHFVTYSEGPDGLEIGGLVRLGLMVDHGVRHGMGGMNLYTVSEHGHAFLRDCEA